MSNEINLSYSLIIRMLAHPYSVLVFVMLLWTSGLVVSKASAGLMTPFELSFSRWILCSLILFTIFFSQIRIYKQTILENLAKLFLLGFLLAMGSTFLVWSVELTTVFNASLLGASQPIITLIIALFVGLEQISKLQYVGILLGLIGVFILITEASVKLILSFKFNTGDLLVLMAVLFYSQYTINLVKWKLRLPGHIVMLTSSISSTLILLPLTVIQSGTSLIQLWLDPSALSIIFFMALFPTALATSLWNRALVKVGANKASVFINLMPVFGAIASILIFGDQFRLYHFHGSLLVIIGVWMVAFTKGLAK